jgi:integrase
MSNASIEAVPAQITLAGVIDRLEGKADLGPTRRRDLISAVRTAARLLHRNPAEIAASLPDLRDRLETIHPLQAGLSAKRLANVKSDLAAAVNMARTTIRIRPRKRGLRPEWEAFIGSLEQPWQRYTFARLARFCSAANIKPTELADAVVDDFQRHLSQTHLAKDPEEIVKITRQTWNGIASRSGGELPMLATPPSKRFITPPLTSYPQSFQEDVDAWLARLSSASMFDEDAPSRALRPTSLRNVKATIRQFAHALVEEGRRPESLASLADLVELDAYKAGLQHFLARNGGERSGGLSNKAGHLVAIAKYHVKVCTEHLERLRTIKKRLSVETGGLTDRNKERLRQFQDDRNVDLLIGLPNRLLRSARSKRKAPSSREALAVMYAVAIEILLACPMRVGNLASLDIEKHLRWHGQGQDQRLAVVIPGSEVKNRQPIEIDLPKESVKLIKTYLSDWRPLLTATPGDALFPANSGKPRLPGHLSQEMKHIIYRETGIKMNAHLFRHMAGMLYLDQNPGEYETVRRLLGHSKLTTTTSFYAPLDNAKANKRYEEAVLAKRRAK